MVEMAGRGLGHAYAMTTIYVVTWRYTGQNGSEGLARAFWSEAEATQMAKALTDFSDSRKFNVEAVEVVGLPQAKESIADSLCRSMAENSMAEMERKQREMLNNAARNAFGPHS